MHYKSIIQLQWTSSVCLKYIYMIIFTNVLHKLDINAGLLLVVEYFHSVAMEELSLLYISSLSYISKDLLPN